MRIEALDPSGATDASFGAADGSPGSTSLFATGDVGEALAVAADGGTFAAATHRFGLDGKTFSNPLLARLTAAGDPVAAFLPPFDAAIFGASSSVGLVADASGRAILAGASSSGELVVARIRDDGTYDPAFSGDGIATAPAPGAGPRVVGLALGPGGTISIASQAGTGSAAGVTRLTADGAVDIAYGAGGVATVPGISFVSGIAVDAAANAFLPGAVRAANDDHPAVAALSTSGTALPGFGSGLLTLKGGGQAVDVAVDANGVVAVGSLRGDVLVWRLTSAGASDKAFSRDGVVTTDFGGASDSARAVALDPQGRIVVGAARVTAGFRGAEYSSSVARYLVAPGHADADADGIGDKKDKCPNVYAAKKPGCPKITRQIQAAIGATKITGKVRAYRDCAPRVPVEIREAKSGELLDRVKTKTDKRFKARIGGAEAVVAVAPRVLRPDTGICLKVSRKLNR